MNVSMVEPVITNMEDHISNQNANWSVRYECLKNSTSLFVLGRISWITVDPEVVSVHQDVFAVPDSFIMYLEPPVPFVRTDLGLLFLVDAFTRIITGLHFLHAIVISHGQIISGTTARYAIGFLECQDFLPGLDLGQSLALADVYLGEDIKYSTILTSGS